MNDETRVLWTRGDLTCLLISCCAGAELQLRRQSPTQSSVPAAEDYEVVLRELYPTKSDLYERARDLELQAGQPGSFIERLDSAPSES
jgi:hypothetical protein